MVRGCGLIQRQKRIDRINKKLDIAEKDIKERQEKLWHDMQDMEGSDISLNDLRDDGSITIRLYNSLYRENLVTLKDAVRFIIRYADYGGNPIRMIRNVGNKSASEFDDVLFLHTGYHAKDIQEMALKIDKEEAEKEAIILKNIDRRQMQTYIESNLS